MQESNGIKIKIDVENMQAAITERQFMMYLQPKYSIAKMKLLEQRLWCAGVIQNVV